MQIPSTEKVAPSFLDRMAYIPKRGRLPLGGIVTSCVITGLSIGFMWDYYTYYDFYKDPEVSYQVHKTVHSESDYRMNFIVCATSVCNYFLKNLAYKSF